MRREYVVKRVSRLGDGPPFPALVLAIAVLPMVLPRAWERRGFQALVVGSCAIRVLALLVADSRVQDLSDAAMSYGSFITTLGALHVTSGGVRVSSELEGRPSTNVALVVLGALLASVVGTTGASMLLIRPFLRANGRRENRAHLVPFFILVVANVGGLLTPLGDPPLLVGYIGGVPFFWTLRLLPAWLVYVGSIVIALYVVDTRAFAREPAAVRLKMATEIVRLRIEGWRSAARMLAVIHAALLPAGLREVAMTAIAFRLDRSDAACLARRERLHVRTDPRRRADLRGDLRVAPADRGLPRREGADAALHKSWQLFWASRRAAAPPLRRARPRARPAHPTLHVARECAA